MGRDCPASGQLRYYLSWRGRWVFASYSTARIPFAADQRHIFLALVLMCVILGHRSIWELNCRVHPPNNEMFQEFEAPRDQVCSSHHNHVHNKPSSYMESTTDRNVPPAKTPDKTTNNLPFCRSRGHRARAAAVLLRDVLQMPTLVAPVPFRFRGCP